MCDTSALLDLGRIAVATGIAAFAGAWAALLIETRREARREEGRRYLALRFAHFATLSQYSELISLRNNALAEHANKEDAWRKLQPLLARFTTPKFSPKDIVFFLESSDPDLINRLTIGQQKFEAFRGTLELRNQYHQEFQARMAALISQGVNVAPDEEELHRVVGKDIIGGLKGTTAALFATAGETAELLRTNLADIEALAAREFPKRRPPKYSVPESVGK